MIDHSEVSLLLEKVRHVSTKFIVVTGGVCSSIGKGILVSSLGVLLKNASYSVSIIKWDPYLNVDPGTMSPLMHGEVFVTADGAETDLDLGHYERLVGLNLEKDSSVSSGQIYQEVLDAEREGRFLGKCIQMIPHAVNIVKKRLLVFALKHPVDFILLEIGGTVGDIEGELFLEAVRQLKMELGQKKIVHSHLSFVPFLEWANEVKTKPTQHSIMQLKRCGLTPDFLFLRTDKTIDASTIAKLSLMCEIKIATIFQVLTRDPLYRVFIDLDAQQVGEEIQKFFDLTPKPSDLSLWHHCIDTIVHSNNTITIALIVKYTGSNDPYISVIEAIKAAGYSLNHRVTIVRIEAEQLERDIHNREASNAWINLKNADGIIIPGGFDNRGIEGKIVACQWAREHSIPYLGLCLGMQVMIIESARSLLHLKDANSTEFNAKTSHPVVYLMNDQRSIHTKGANMRLGSYVCAIKKGTRAYNAYKVDTVIERHRHRYEVNPWYKDNLEKVGLIFSGTHSAMDLIEITEIKEHPFMVGVQFHPEFLSSPVKAHPLFRAFMEAIIKKDL